MSAAPIASPFFLTFVKALWAQVRKYWLSLAVAFAYGARPWLHPVHAWSSDWIAMLFGAIGVYLFADMVVKAWRAARPARPRAGVRSWR